jgi:hypothetical protein
MKYVLILLFLVSCSNDRNKVQTILEGEGCTRTVVGGWTPFCCDKHDTFTNSFQCTRNGHSVEGCVCSGWLKGYTVRYQ